MEAFAEFVAVPAIVVICAFAGYCYKTFTDADNKYIPIVCGGLGLVLGVVCYYLVPGIVPGDNIVVAVAVGIVSGLAATGAHQAIKQMTGGSN